MDKRPSILFGLRPWLRTRWRATKTHFKIENRSLWLFGLLVPRVDANEVAIKDVTRVGVRNPRRKFPLNVGDIYFGDGSPDPLVWKNVFFPNKIKKELDEIRQRPTEEERKIIEQAERAAEREAVLDSSNYENYVFVIDHDRFSWAKDLVNKWRFYKTSPLGGHVFVRPKVSVSGGVIKELGNQSVDMRRDHLTKFSDEICEVNQGELFNYMDSLFWVTPTKGRFFKVVESADHHDKGGFHSTWNISYFNPARPFREDLFHFFFESLDTFNTGINGLEVSLGNESLGGIGQGGMAEVSHAGISPFCLLIVTVTVAQEEGTETLFGAGEVITGIGACATKIAYGFFKSSWNTNFDDVTVAKHFSDFFGITLIGFDAFVGFALRR